MLRSRLNSVGRRGTGSIAGRIALVLTVLVPPVALFAGRQPSLAVVPPSVLRAVCGPGSIQERGIQGRVTAADYATGLRCNLELVGRTGPPLGGFRTHRYVDPHGRECAYYDRFPGMSSNPAEHLAEEQTGTFAVDMSDPAHPRVTESLRAPGPRVPHESLSLHAGRGLLAAVMGSAATAPGFVAVYDLTQDCRHPVLISSLPLGIAGHEGSFSPDGMTYWASGGAIGYWTGSRAGTLTAVDVSDPHAPRLLWAGAETGHGLNLSADGNTLYYADVDRTPGLTTLDVSQVQSRAPNPKVRRLSYLTWDTVAIPQTAIPVTIGGHPYLVEVDEFTYDGTFPHNPTGGAAGQFLTGRGGSNPTQLVGAARMIDVADPSAPRVVSDIRLEANSPEARAGEQAQDPGADTLWAYAAHYCAVPQAEDPGIVACSFLLSGLRVFDIRDPAHPVEVAYYNPPGTTTAPYRAASAPAFAPERREIWYTDGNYGFFALKVTNGAWPKA